MRGIIFVAEGCKKCAWLKKQLKTLPEGVRFYYLSAEHAQQECEVAAEALAEIMWAEKELLLLSRSSGRKANQRCSQVPWRYGTF